MRPSLEQITRNAYFAYGKAVDFKNFRGDSMPEWEDLGELIQNAWRQAATSILATTFLAFPVEADLPPQSDAPTS